MYSIYILNSSQVSRFENYPGFCNQAVCAFTKGAVFITIQEQERRIALSKQYFFRRMRVEGLRIIHKYMLRDGMVG